MILCLLLLWDSWLLVGICLVIIRTNHPEERNYQIFSSKQSLACRVRSQTLSIGGVGGGAGGGLL